MNKAIKRLVGDLDVCQEKYAPFVPKPAPTIDDLDPWSKHDTITGVTPLTVQRTKESKTHEDLFQLKGEFTSVFRRLQMAERVGVGLREQLHQDIREYQKQTFLPRQAART